MSTAGPSLVADLRPKMKLWLSSGEEEGVFGDGKWRLLEAIDREGSLKAATDALGISYRKAWGDLRRAEEALGIRFTEKHRGGSEGGESHLTEEGKRWLTAYGRFRSSVEKAIADAFDDQFTEICVRP